MNEAFVRTEALLGKAAMKRLQESRVAVFGLGGVGGYVVEALARSGIGALDLVDADTIAVSNLNRQILATVETIGKSKVDVAASRVLSINPDCKVRTYKMFFLPGAEEKFDFTAYDYIVDAVDTVTAKLALAEISNRLNIMSISCMGTGNKLDPTALKVADIASTTVCPLAKVMRHELKKRGIMHLKVVYSTEAPKKPDAEMITDIAGVRNEPEGKQVVRRATPASSAFVPAAAGLIIAAEVISDLSADKAQ